MTTQEILAALTNYSSKFPRAALSEASQHIEELVPFFLDALDNICDNADKLIEEKSPYDLHFYAMYLLSQFREKKAFPKLVRFLKKDESTLDYFLGDALTSGYDRCLSSTYDGNLDILKELIEGESFNEYARGAALDAYGLIARNGRITREEIINYFRSLIYDRLPNDTSMLPTMVSSCIMDEHLFELIPDVKYLYDNDLIDSSFHGEYDDFIDYIFDYSRHAKEEYIDDVIKELQHWAKYDEERKPRPKPPVKQLPVKQPTIETKKKIGRNDPCPCGSGKKYKKCCLSLGISFNSKAEDKKDELAEDSNSIMDFLRGSYDETKPYDLMKNYPSREPPSGDGKRTITEFYSGKAIEIDIPVYKALCHREIPMFVKRDTLKEDLERIDFLLKAFTMFTQICEDENLKTFTAFDSKYMVHYESGLWVSVLSQLLEKYVDIIPAQALAARKAVDAALTYMGSARIPPKRVSFFKGLTGYLDGEDDDYDDDDF